MADAPHFVRSLKLTAFRSYLVPAAFDFSKRKCLAVLGPNRHGKSSLIDGFEFIVSDDGTLERLGKVTAQTKAGPLALAHNGAEQANLAPEVEIELVQGGTVTKGSRPAAGSKRPRPAEVTALKTCFVVDPIIRGHSLRGFVEEQTPESRYTAVAGWLDLTPLVEVQKILRTLRTAVKADADATQAIDRVNAALKKATDSTVEAWDTAAVCGYINTRQLAPLDQALTMQDVAKSDPGYVMLLERAAAEEKLVGLAALKQMRGTAEKLHRLEPGAADGLAVDAGLVPEFEAAAALAQAAEAEEQEEHDKAKNVLFQSVWQAAEPLFAGGNPPEACPICETPIAASTAGSAETVHQHVSANLANLAQYAAAKGRKDTTAESLRTIKARLDMALEMLIGALADHYPACVEAAKEYRVAIDAWAGGDVPSSAAPIEALSAAHAALDKAIKDIEGRQGDHTYAKATAKIDALIELGAEYRLAMRVAQELRKLSDALTAQSAQISGAIRVKVQSLLDRLQTPMNEIFAAIQGPGAPPIRLELPKEDETNQQKLSLLIDFAQNRLGVQPSGYLSDSQIHSVALALRMAAVLAFNGRAPIIILDDIVTSYDVDHRRSIVQLLALKFAAHQVIITTHDERFFYYLKDILPDADWKYTRIIGLDPAFGPRFADHKVTDAMIETRWALGESAANEMRQAEEEFLLTLARDFGVQVRIRPLERPYKYDRSELASAVAAYLKGAGLTPNPVPGIANRFLTTLQKGEVENFGSHFSDDPGAFASLGDEKTRWKEFQQFREQFACSKCKGSRFQRPIQLTKPLCAKENCETQFTFAPAALYALSAAPASA